MKVPLIPYQRPMPAVFLKKEEPKPTKPKDEKRKPTMAKLKATNIEDITKKPGGVQKLWKLLSKMDPNGDLFTDDIGIIAVAGSTAKNAPKRTPAALSLDDDESEMVSGFAIYDSPEPDNAELATGVIFTVYQLVEIAFALGVQFESDRLTRTMTAAAGGAVDDDDDDDEEFDTEDSDEMEEVSDEDDSEDDEDDSDDDDDDE